MNLGEGWPKPSFAEARIAAQEQAQEAVDRALLLSPILAALDQLTASVQALDIRPHVEVASPSVLVPPTDHSALVPALVEALTPLLQREDSAPLAQTLAAMTEQITKISRKLSGGYLGGGGGGGPLTLAGSGAVTATNPLPVVSADLSVLAHAAVLNTSGANTFITPSAGKSVRLHWVEFLPSSDNVASNLVTVSFVTSGITPYIGYAVAHAQTFTGAVNEPLTVTLATSEPVAVTVHYQEI